MFGGGNPFAQHRQQPQQQPRPMPAQQRPYQPQRPMMPQRPSFAAKKAIPTDSEKQMFSKMLEDLIGTRGAYILDNKLSILGKVPVTELGTTVKSLSSGIYAIVLDGNVDKELALTADKTNVKFIVCMGSEAKPEEVNVSILTSSDL